MKRTLKKITGVLLSATLFAGTVAASPAIAGTSADMLVKADENALSGAVTYIYGDVDLNNKLEAVDALAILKHVVKLTPLNGELVLELADVDHDASIAAADALAVLKCVVGLQTPAYCTVTPPASETPPATESANPESPAPSETVTPTEAPTPDVTETPAASDPVKPTETPDVTETPAPTATPDVTETVVPTETPDVTVQPTDTPEPTVQPTDTPKPTEIPDVTETPKPTASVEPTPDVTIEPTKTPMPTVKPTDTPKPTVAPTETVKPTVTPTETPAPHVHNYTSTITLEATCGKDGVETFTCECGDSFTKPIPATGEHTYERTEETVWIVDKEAYDEEVIDQKTVWVCHGCPTDTYFYSPDEINSHRKETGHSSIEQVIQRNVKVVHHEEAGHYENVYVCTGCKAVKEYTKPDPATCEHTYERTENRVWIVDQEAYDEVITEKAIHVCSCGAEFDSVERLGAHQSAMINADVPGHGWSSVKYKPVHEVIHHEEVGHYENEVSYKCSRCDTIKVYCEPETCTHEWYVAHETWDEEIAESHLFCKCGYDCGFYDPKVDITTASNEYEAHFLSLVDLDILIWDENGLQKHPDDDVYMKNYEAYYAHDESSVKYITATYPHDATYRCALCGKYKDIE